jgi:phospholipid/cholesterol/gamma-HCH transport system ATP-binding protein
MPTQIKIKIENVSFFYQPGLAVIRRVNLEIREREIFVIAGQCGCGKSTLIKLMAGLLTPSVGTIHINGKDIHKLAKEDLVIQRLDFGFLFQNSALISYMSVYENIALPLRYHKSIPSHTLHEMVDELVRKVGLFGYDSRLPSDLSVGQTRRAAVARSLIMDPKLMFYDEPTAGLDPINSQSIRDIIRDRYSEHKTTSVIITHDIPFALSLATRIAIMYRGRIIFIGTPDEVMSSKEPYVREFTNAYTRKT